MKNVLINFLLMSTLMGTSYAAPAAADETRERATSAVWISGGGELFTDKINPWFLDNTKTATYCVAIDEQNFGTTLDSGRRQIQKALAYWKRQFTFMNFHDQDNNQSERTPRVGTQQFVEVDCGAHPDITFQLGTLSKTQAEFMEHPKELVGFTVRTSYDTRQLKGRGFVYISPESGPYALDESSYALDHSTLAEHRWQHADGLLLELVLIHELSHVFGMPTKIDPLGSSNPLDPAFCAILVATGKLMPDDFVIPDIAQSSKELHQPFRMMGQYAADLYGCPGCEVALIKGDSVFNLEFWAAKKEGEPFQLLGYLHLGWTESLSYSNYIYLPKDQGRERSKVASYDVDYTLHRSYIYESLDRTIRRTTLFAISYSGVTVSAVGDNGLIQLGTLFLDPRWRNVPH